MGADIRAWQARYGPWALVLGASEGLGAAFAEALAARGLQLALVARRAERLEAMAQDLQRRYGVAVQTRAQDLADPEALADIAAWTAPLDLGLVVYNAALGNIAPFLAQTYAQHQQTEAVNLRGPWQAAWHFGARLRTRGKGGLLLMSSLAGFQGTPLIAHYAATKAYSQVLAEGLYAEWRAAGVDVLACTAGATLTPNYLASEPRKNRFAPPEQAPAAVVAEALRALGCRPYIVTGRGNRLVTTLLRLLPRPLTLRIMARASTEMYAR